MGARSYREIPAVGLPEPCHLRPRDQAPRHGDDPKEYAKIARAACNRVVGALEKLILDANRAKN
jgi:hypothetical protein